MPGSIANSFLAFLRPLPKSRFLKLDMNEEKHREAPDKDLTLVKIRRILKSVDKLGIESGGHFNAHAA
jgi:hypothetical protein